MKKIKSDEINETIRNRESWLKVSVILLFSFLITWKLLTSPLNINLSDFNFTDLLSLILALFAVALSITFYFKVIETSNDFYNNTYRFTNETSEILGRIEAGFGERLRHLDEGYTGLRDKIEKFPIDTYQVEKQVKEEEDEVKNKEEERDKLIESLAEKAKLEENEKIELFTKLKELEKELNDAKSTVAFFQKQLKKADIKTGKDRHRKDRMMRYIQRFLIDKMDIKEMDIREINIITIKKRFNSIKDELSPELLDDMQEFGLVNSEMNLTDEGAIEIVQIIHKT